jgi:hypothetical protein
MDSPKTSIVVLPQLSSNRCSSSIRAQKNSRGLTPRKQSPIKLTSPKSPKENWALDLTVNRTLKFNPFQNAKDLPKVPRPALPEFDSNSSFVHKMAQINGFITQFEYNYIEQYFFNIDRSRSLYSIIRTAKEIIRESLPIRCVEGTFLGM